MSAEAEEVEAFCLASAGYDGQACRRAVRLTRKAQKRSAQQCHVVGGLLATVGQVRQPVLEFAPVREVKREVAAAP